MKWEIKGGVRGGGESGRKELLFIMWGRWWEKDLGRIVEGLGEKN